MKSDLPPVIFLSFFSDQRGVAALHERRSQSGTFPFTRRLITTYDAAVTENNAAKQAKMIRTLLSPVPGDGTMLPSLSVQTA